MHNIFIWSNYKTDLSSLTTLPFSTKCDTHVFINGAYPFISNVKLFDDNYKILFIRNMSTSSKFYDQDIITPYINSFNRIFRVYDNNYDFISEIEKNDKSYKKEYLRIYLDNKSMLKQLIDNPKFGRSTGFMAFFSLFNIFESFTNIILVNFNRKQPSGDYIKSGYQNHHNISHEEQFYLKNNIKNIII